MLPVTARRVPDPPGAAVDAVRRHAATATSTTATTSTRTTAPATSSSSPGSACTRTSASWTPTRPCARATTSGPCGSRTRSDDRSIDAAVGPYRIEVHRAAAARPAGVRRRRARPRLRPHLGGLVRGGRGAAPRHADGRSGHPRRRPASRRSARGRARCRVGGDEHAVSPDRVGRHPRPLVGHPAGRRGRSRRVATPTSRSRGSGGCTSPCGSTTSPSSLIAQELPDGFRTLNDATRMWARRAGRAARLARGRDRVPVRHPPSRAGGAAPHRRAAASRSTIEVETLGSVVLHVGAGYGGDPDWCHGQWRGPELRRGRGVRPDRSRHRRPHPVRRDRPRRPGHVRRRRGLGAVRARHDRPPRPVRVRRLGFGRAVGSGGAALGARLSIELDPQ